MPRCVVLAVCLACALGCRSGTGARVADRGTGPEPVAPSAAAVERVSFEPDGTETPDADGAPSLSPAAGDEPQEYVLPEPLGPPTLAEVADSVRTYFPRIHEAVATRTIASGETLAAEGAFDHKLEGYSNSQPLDYYKNYRQSIDLKRNTYWGGQVFAGYRIGRGSFEPWYQERATDKGGEFKAGVLIPLAQNRGIDANRAELWRAQLEQGRVEPEIRAMVIGSIRDASIAYWEWVASAELYRVAEEVLQLGLDRQGYLQRQVELGEKAEIDLVDNQRMIVSRRAKLIDARRKLEQSAVKLSLYFRDGLGEPVLVPIEDATVGFPEALPPQSWGDEADVSLAKANRPELEELQLARRQLSVLLRQACNETRPQVDAGLLVGQDVGEPTSAKRDKSELELEAALLLSVPLERRKALGKARQLRGKIAQLRAKTRFAADKIAAEAQAAHAALTAAAERVTQTQEGVVLAEEMRKAEQRLYEAGQSTLLDLNLRELQSAEAAFVRVAALYDYHTAQADYAATLGLESVEAVLPSTQ